MALPKQVQRQMEEAQQLEATMRGENPAPQETPVQPEVTPETPATPAPEAQPTPAPEPVVTVNPKDVEIERHKYEVLRGKYEAEVPRLHQQNRALQEQLATLSQQVDELKKPKKSEEPAKPMVTEKDVEDFGSDMVDMVRRVAVDTVQNILDTQLRSVAIQLESRVARLEGVVHGVADQQMSQAERAFYADLHKAVPNYEAINTEPAWLAWLAEADPLIGRSRQAALDEASAAWDAKRVAAFFLAYEATKPKQPEKPAPAATSELESQVAPSRASASVTPTAQNKPFWNDKAVAAFYQDVAKGKFRGREAEMQRIENDINAAVLEGRYLRG